MLCCCAKTLPSKVEERTLDNVHHWRPLKIGNSYLLCGKKNTAFPQHLFVGPEWPCMVITNILIIVPTYYFIINVAIDISIGLAIAAAVTGLTLLIMFAATACSEPGIVWIPGDGETQAKSPEEKLESGYKVAFDPAKSTGQNIACGQCTIDRPRTAHHCYECGLCVEDLDHHCPWTGKCIAKKNLEKFHYFLYSLCFHLIFIVGILIYNISNTPLSRNHRM